MSNLERRYRRVLRLLPGWYRDQWEQDMVAAFLDSWVTGDPEADQYILKAAGPGLAEVASVASLAGRLYLGGGDTPRRHFGWGQALRRAVLALTLVQATRGFDILVRTAWSRHVFGWLPAPPAGVVLGTPSGPLPPAAWYLVAYAWIVAFILLALRYHRTAQVVAALAIVPDLVVLVQGEWIGALRSPIGPWAFLALINLAPVVGMTAFHRGAPPVARWPWLLALPANFVLVAVPLIALAATGNSDWVPDFSGLYCILVAVACLAHAPRAWSSRVVGSSVWSLALVLLAADAGAYRIFSIADYTHDPHLIKVCLAELLILAAGVALVAADAARAWPGRPAPTHYPQPQPV